MSRCSHYLNAPEDRRYHVPLGPSGIDCCVSCYATINRPDDIAVFTALNRAFLEQQTHDYRQAEWLLAEKDAVIDGLRDAIEMLEADDLPAVGSPEDQP